MYEYPTSRFVADFLGDVNVLEARVVEAGRDQVRMHSAAGRLRRSWPTAAKVPSPARRCGWPIRPEKIRHRQGAARPSGPPTAWPATIWDIGYLGDVSIYHVRLDSGAVVRCTQANRVRRLIERPITWEDRVWLSWGSDASVILKA